MRAVTRELGVWYIQHAGGDTSGNWSVDVRSGRPVSSSTASVTGAVQPRGVHTDDPFILFTHDWIGCAKQMKDRRE